MKILLDLRSIQNLESGDGQFSAQIIKHLATLDHDNEYSLLVTSKNRSLFETVKPNFNFVIEDLKPYSISEYVYLASRLSKIKPDIYHTFTFSYPINIKCKTIISIYDLTHLFFPSLFSFRLRQYYKFVVSACIKRADRVLTISENSKSDIINKFNISHNKVANIYCGINPLYRRINQIDARNYIRDKFGISEKFMLYVGQIKRHKNIGLIVHCLKKLAQEGPDNIKFVICGRNVFKATWLLGLVKELDVESKIIFIDTPIDMDLLNLYNAADLFVLPSLYEGFGLAALEAISCGTPVVSSNAGALPEVLGSAARFAPPDDIAGFSAAIKETLYNKDHTEYFKNEGLKRSSFFSWEKVTQRLLDIYKTLS